MILFFFNKNYAYSFGVDIEDSTTFFSLPANTEDTIALYLYNHVVERTPELKKIKIIFNYEEDLDERASIGHSRKSEYAVRGKRLVKLKHDMEWNHQLTKKHIHIPKVPCWKTRFIWHKIDNTFVVNKNIDIY